ncbi:hypothetical protein H9P43_009647 [Blastocladiella emersonii ATCC 22665]|nr:hypothetical protein H9P43_009647 [Blastocladiella emersonii ATCC 22665]
MKQKRRNRSNKKSSNAESPQFGLGALLHTLAGPKLLQLAKPRRAVAAASGALRDAARDDSVVVTWTTRTVLAHPAPSWAQDSGGFLHDLVSSPTGRRNTTLRMADMFNSILESYHQLDPDDWAPPIVQHGLSRVYLTCIAQRVAGALVLPVSTKNLSEQLSKSIGGDLTDLLSAMRLGSNAKKTKKKSAQPRPLSQSPVGLAVILCLFLTMAGDADLLGHFLGELLEHAPGLLSTPVEPHVWNSIDDNVFDPQEMLRYPDPLKPEGAMSWEPKVNLTRPIKPTLLEVLAGNAIAAFNDGVRALVAQPRFGMDGRRFVEDFLNSRGPRHFQHARIRTQPVTAAGVKAIHDWLVAHGWRDSDPRTQYDGSTCQWFTDGPYHEVVLAVFEHFDVPFHKATKWEQLGEVRHTVKDMFRDFGMPKPALLEKNRKARLYGGRERSDLTDREWAARWGLYDDDGIDDDDDDDGFYDDDDDEYDSDDDDSEEYDLDEVDSDDADSDWEDE